MAAKVNWEKKVFQDALKESSLDCLFSLGCRPGLEEGKGGEEGKNEWGERKDVKG